MKNIITMGEMMMRLSCLDHEKINQSNKFNIHFGGGEANVSIALSNFGLNTSFISALPDNELGDCVLNELRKYGVDTNHLIRKKGRLGLYYFENGSAMRPSNVIYDRKNSSFSNVRPNDFNFRSIFKDFDWFHVSGITPALGKETAELTIVALRAAKEMGLTTSFDMNYRTKLWSKEEARDVLFDLLVYVDVFFGGNYDFKEVLGIKPSYHIKRLGEKSIKGQELYYKEIINRFGFKYITSTKRITHSASDHVYSASLFDGRKTYYSDQFDIRVVDRVGGGDSYTSGLIYGLITEMSINDALNFGVCASLLKHTIPGDINLSSLDEIKKVISGDISGREQI
jgi:2-dehydro-3-deoxygluconokinase